MRYMTCEYCGAHLDFGEICDCEEKKKTIDCLRESTRQDNGKSNNANEEAITWKQK